MNAVIAPMLARLDFMDPVRESVIAGLQAYIAPVEKPVVVYVDNQVSVSQWSCCELRSLLRSTTGRTPETRKGRPRNPYRSATYVDGCRRGACQSTQADGPKDPSRAAF